MGQSDSIAQRFGYFVGRANGYRDAKDTEFHSAGDYIYRNFTLNEIYDWKDHLYVSWMPLSFDRMKTETFIINETGAVMNRLQLSHYQEHRVIRHKEDTKLIAYNEEYGIPKVPNALEIILMDAA